VFFESFYGKTIGKMVTKTHVVDRNNKKPSAWKVIIRTLFRLFPFGPIVFLFGFDCLHDICSRTNVVKN
jgi:uncharacterized RDD family membrane protein YckC